VNTQRTDGALADAHREDDAEALARRAERLGQRAELGRVQPPDPRFALRQRARDDRRLLEADVDLPQHRAVDALPAPAAEEAVA